MRMRYFCMMAFRSGVDLNAARTVNITNILSSKTITWLSLGGGPLAVRIRSSSFEGETHRLWGVVSCFAVILPCQWSSSYPHGELQRTPFVFIAFLELNPVEAAHGTGLSLNHLLMSHVSNWDMLVAGRELQTRLTRRRGPTWSSPL